MMIQLLPRSKHTSIHYQGHVNVVYRNYLSLLSQSQLTREYDG